MAIMTTTTQEDLYNLIELELQKQGAFLENEAVASGMFIKEEKPNNTGKFLRFEEFDAEQYASTKGEGVSASKFKTQVGYAKDIELKRIAKNVEVTYEAQNYNKYSAVTFAVESAMKSLNARFDLDLQHRITFAGSTAYTDRDGNSVDVTVGDGLALASTSHTVRASASTYRNILANNPKLSRGALESMERMWINNTINHFGQKVGRKADVLWTTDEPTTCNTARELLQSTAAVAAPNSGVTNVYEGKYRHVMLCRVATDADGAANTAKQYYWGLAATGSDGWQAKYAINEAPHMMPLDQSNHYDVDADLYKFPLRAGYGIATLSGRFFAISYGDGTA